MSRVEECSERECRKFDGGLNNKVKLAIYKTFGKNVEFKKYLHGVSDAGTRSGTHGLHEELGRHRGREGKFCVVLSVRAWCMCCGSVRLIVVVELVLC